MNQEEWRRMLDERGYDYVMTPHELRDKMDADPKFKAWIEAGARRATQQITEEDQ